MVVGQPSPDAELGQGDLSGPQALLLGTCTRGRGLSDILSGSEQSVHDLTFPPPGGQGLSGGAVWKEMDGWTPLTDNLATPGNRASSCPSFLGPNMGATGQPRLNLRLVRAFPAG